MLTRLWIEDAILFFALSIAAPALAVFVGYAAWLGKPRNWDRSRYWAVFVVSLLASGFVIVYAQRMRVDLTSWSHLLQLSIFSFGLLLFGVAGGCLIGVFTYEHGRGPIWRRATTQSQNSNEDIESDRNPSF